MLRPSLCDSRTVNADKRYLPTESFYTHSPSKDRSVILHLIATKINII